MSGGVDSYACAHFFQNMGHSVVGIFVDFGQAALEPERDAVSKIASALGVSLSQIHVNLARRFEDGEVPGRNAFLTTSALISASQDVSLIAMGIHAGTPYYDCSPSFVDRMQCLVAECSNGRIAFSAPFVSWSKSRVYQYAQNENLQLSITYSCETGSVPPCGECASCKDRELLYAC